MARAALDWSQLDLAEMSGVGSTSIKKFELGTALRPALLARLRGSMEAAGIGFIDEGEKVRGRRAAFGVFLASDAPTPERAALQSAGSTDLGPAAKVGSREPFVPE